MHWKKPCMLVLYVHGKGKSGKASIIFNAVNITGEDDLKFEITM